MTVQNTFDRVQLNALVGAWTGLPFNLTTNSIDWWHAPITGTSLTTGARRKATGGSVITPSILVPGTDSTYLPGGANTWHTWTDEATGQTPTNSGHVSGNMTIGNGYRFTVAAPKWPDYRELWVWTFQSDPTQLTFTASMDDTDCVTQTDGIGGTPDLVGDNDAYKTLGSLVTKVRFASNRSGKTMTLDITRNGVSMGSFGLVAAALYNSTPTTGSGPSLSYIASGGCGPLGAR